MRNKNGHAHGAIMSLLFPEEVERLDAIGIKKETRTYYR